MDHPDLAATSPEIIMMGGAVETVGNTFENPDAEWNLWIDPVADSEVMAADLPISIVPLDATNEAPLTTDFVERLSEHLTTPEAQAVYDIADAQLGNDLRRRRVFLGSARRSGAGRTRGRDLAGT